MDDLVSSLPGRRVLVVDSHPDSLHLLGLFFDGCSLDFKTAISVEQALDLLPTFRPHLVISELCLPRQDGFLLIQKIKAYTARNQLLLPAIALTTQASAADRDRAIVAGYSRHIAKPVDFQELLAAIVQLLEEANRPSSKSHQQDVDDCRCFAYCQC